MTFREKSAWISLVTTLGVYVYYFWNLAEAQGRTGPWLLGLLVGCIVILTLLQIALHIAVAIRSPREAAAPSDERETLIALKSANIAFYILVTGAVLVSAGLMFVGEPFILGNVLLAALVLAELTKYASQVIYFRQGV